ncbi:MAG TPA: carboxypeptidase regulatory-like domain-containing protein [Candidatus Acidoferrum sp.]|nr:carboxypeptidase regulatory-like domain-containing protein [Candidatus Acidoferrum sp.]
MQSKQVVCVSASLQPRLQVSAWRFIFLGALLLFLVLGAPRVSAQVNTATLSGTVSDPQNLGVKGAKVTLTNAATGATRIAVADDNGRYNLVGIPPGRYKMTVDGGSSFGNYENPSVVLTVGENASFDPRLELKGMQQTVTVSAETAPIETTKTEVSDTVGQRQIENLPINGRNYINFTLINSQTTRDMAPTIGPAPNSGLSIGGARARGNMVSVDGADAVDNSINGIRSTISQEGVQEFQLILSNYNAEYGRATGGVVNIVTKSGSNEFHGDAFGYFRNKAFQARNAFSGQVDPLTGALDPVKQAYTRTQSGLTFGGPLKKDKTFYFFSYEYTQREETGFSSIGADNFGLSPFSCGGCQLQGLLLTPSQTAATGALLQAAGAAAAGGNAALAGALQQEAGSYAVFMGSASNVAVNGIDFGAVANGFYQQHGIPLTATPGPQFPIPVACPAGLPVNNGATCSPFGVYVAPLPASYVTLNSIRGNYPVMEKTSLWSARLDQRWNNRNNSFLRVGVSPSLITGLPSTSQNQVFGQNSGSRAGYNQSRDLSVTFQHDTIINDKTFNEFRSQIARRGLHFGFSQLPGGSNIGVNIPGYGYFGREPYSTVDRIERRFEFTDNVTLVRGAHTFKVGGDYNLIQLRSAKAQIFELDFGGDVNFGGFSAGTFLFDCVNPATGTNHNGSCASNEIALPGTTALQSYGLGVPTSYIQGIGSSNQPFDNIPIALFGQDNWRVNRHLTVNYGVRYDVELTPLFTAATAVNAAAEKALGVVEGIPRNYKDVAPRFGLAWDPAGNGKTVIRAGYGMFYDHPLLATAFDSVTADGGRSVQLISTGGTPSACQLVTAPAGTPGFCGGGLDGPTNLNGSSIFQGVLNAPAALGMFYLPNQQRFNPTASGSIFANQAYLQAGFPLPILPFTLPIARNFKYAYANQANLTVERELAGSWKFSLGYQWTRGIHLNRPLDLNSTDPKLLDQNAFNAAASGLSVTNPLTVVVPSNAAPFSCISTSGATSILVMVPGVMGEGFPGSPNCSTQPVGIIGTPAFFNFFRRSGPNPSFAAAFPGLPPIPGFFPNGVPSGFAGQVALAQFAGYPQGFGVPVPWNSVDAQLSSGNSWYNALTFNLSKRFSKGFELLSSYTYSHSIDDSTDLQSPLEPQDSRFPFLERSNSDNDQRHRWVTSAVFQSPSAKSGDGALKHFVGDFALSPIVEFSSGRPYNVITGEDTRLDLGASQARPSVAASGTAGTTSSFIPGVVFVPANTCLGNSGQAFGGLGFAPPPAGCDGNLGRNRFVMPNFFQWDMRLSRAIPLGERLKLDLIADAFNLFNRTNIAAVNQLCDPTAGTTCFAGQPTAAYDARQFQFALKLSW